MNFRRFFLEKHGLNEFFGKVCLEWFEMEWSEIETSMKHFFEPLSHFSLMLYLHVIKVSAGYVKKLWEQAREK